MPRRPRSQFEEGPRSAAEEWEEEEEEAGEFEPPNKRPRLDDDESDESHHDGDGSVDGAPATATNDDVPDDILARARSTLTQVLARRERIQYAHQVPPPPTASVPQQQRLPMVAPPPPATQRRQPPPPPLNPVGPRVIVPTGGPGSVVPPAAANTAATVRRVTFVPLSQIVADTRAAEHRAVADAVNAAAAAAGVAAAEAVGGGGGGGGGPAAVVTSVRPPAAVGSHCFVCGFGNRAFDGGDMGCRPYVTLINMMVDDYGHMDNAELGLHMHDYYHKQLYNPAAALLAPGEAHPLPRMTAADFVAHIERHTLDPIIIIGENTRMLRDVIEVVRNQLVDEQTRDVDVKKVDALVKLVKAQKELLSVSASSLLFGGGAGRNGAALVLDPSAVGAVANTRRIAPLLATASGTIGGATAADTGAARGNVPVFNGPAAAATAPGPPMLPI